MNNVYRVHKQLVAGATVADIVDAINDQAGTIVTATAVSNGANIEIALNTAGGTLSLESDGTLVGNGIPTKGSAAKQAKYTFQVNGVPAEGKVITVAIGSKTYSYTVTATDVSTGTAAGLATNVAAAITGDYTAAADASGLVTITQAVAAPTTGKSLTVSNN